jgi:hypothetical protein
MQKRKKGFIIATAVLVGTLSVGGTADGIFKKPNTLDRLNKHFEICLTECYQN